MFNLQGSEIIVILLIALVVLGPERLPDAVRRFMQTYNELKKMGSGFQAEIKSAFDEPMREMRDTAQTIRDAADPTKLMAEAEAENRIEADAKAAVAADPVAADPAVAAGIPDQPAPVDPVVAEPVPAEAVATEPVVIAPVVETPTVVPSSSPSSSPASAPPPPPPRPPARPPARPNSSNGSNGSNGSIQDGSVAEHSGPAPS